MYNFQVLHRVSLIPVPLVGHSNQPSHLHLRSFPVYISVVRPLEVIAEDSLTREDTNETTFQRGGITLRGVKARQIISIESFDSIGPCSAGYKQSQLVQKRVKV